MIHMFFFSDMTQNDDVVISDKINEVFYRFDRLVLIISPKVAPAIIVTTYEWFLRIKIFMETVKISVLSFECICRIFQKLSHISRQYIF